MEKNIRENERNAGMKKAAMLKKRRRRKRIIAVLVSLALILAVTLSVLSVAFLFRVDEIKVLKNETIYTETEIIKASKIEIDDSLLFINSGNIETEIIRVLPYIKTASIKRILPSAVEISVTKTEKIVCVLTGGKYYAADKDGKILEKLNGADEDLPILEISENCVVEIGQIIKIENETESNIFLKYINLIESCGYKIDSINIVDADSSFMNVEGRLLVKIGSSNYFDLKLAHFNTTFKTMSETTYGTVDLTSWNPKKQEAFFTSSDPFQ